MQFLEQFETPRFFVAGQFESDKSAAEMAKVNPADESDNPPILIGRETHIRAVANNARDVFNTVWSLTPPGERKMIMLRAAELIRAKVDILAPIDTQEMGRPISNTREDVMVAAGFMQYYGEAIDKLYGQTAPGARGFLETQRLVPLGVVLAITPWNFPLINAALKIAPALAAGNCVIVKPSEHGSFSALALAEILVEAGLPKGVVNVVTGDGETAQSLIANENVDMVTFTGSSLTGSKIMQAAGAHGLKPVALECGGKNPQIIFDDAVTPDMAGFVAFTTMWNSGQVCIQKSRLLVQASVFSQVKEMLAHICGTFPVGMPLDDATALGPLASRGQYERVGKAIQAAEDGGAEFVLDGRRTGRGFYVGPTIVSNSRSIDAVWQDEIFGPVVSVEPFDTDEEALAMANDTPYGLSATVWTNNMSRGHRFGEALNAGKVAIMSRPAPPDGCWAAHSAEPAKNSGFGVEGGLGAFKTYSRLKSTQFIY